jgi:hypothetical protein
MTQNGYIEIEISGRKTGLKFNMYAIERMGEIKGVPVSGVRYITALVYGGILGNAYAKQVEPEFTFEDVLEWVDENSGGAFEGSILEKIKDTFINSNVYQHTINRANGEPSEDAKKKMIATP